MDHRLPALDRLVGCLGSLLSILDAAKRGSGEGIGHAWSRCAEAFEEFRALDRELGPPRAPYPAEVREKVKEAQRLHAIAAALTEGLRDGVGGERRQLIKARAHLDSLRGEARIGNSCDIAG